MDGKGKVIVGFVAALLLAPVVVWFIEAPFFGEGLSGLSRALGRVTGFVGLTLLAVALVLGLKLRPLDQAFGGLNRQYYVHHVMAAIGFVLIVFHPLFSAASALTFSAAEALGVLFPRPMELATLAGWLAWLVFTAIVVTTFFLPVPHRGWRIVHVMSWPIFFVAWGHAVALTFSGPLVAGISLSYLLVLLVALTATGIRLVLLVIGPYRHEYVVTGKTVLSPKMVELRMQPSDTRVDFAPGQFMYVRFEDPEAGWHAAEYHPFTISSGIHDGDLAMTIKALGDTSTRILDLDKGARARMHGPYGRFIPPVGSVKKQIWIGGGVGITPFLSAVRSMDGSRADEIHLFYCEDSAEGAVFLDELGQAAERVEGLSLHPILADRDGYPTGKAIAELSGGLEGAEVFLCGPGPMTAALQKDFKALGLPRACLHSEEFSFF